VGSKYIDRKMGTMQPTTPKEINLCIFLYLKPNWKGKNKNKELPKCSEVIVCNEGSPAVSQNRRHTFNKMLQISCKPYEH
jgi:hypothetical protein